MSHYTDLVDEHARLTDELEPLMQVKSEAIEAKVTAIETVKAIAAQTNPIEARLSELDGLIALGEDRLTALSRQVIAVEQSVESGEVGTPGSS